jgi:hypothetical protein
MVEKFDCNSIVVFLLSLWVYFGFGIMSGFLREILCVVVLLMIKFGNAAKSQILQFLVPDRWILTVLGLS